MENLKYRVIYEYKFHRGTSAAEMARRVNVVYGGCVAKENTVRFRFQRFRSGNFDLQNKPRGQPEIQVSNEELIVEGYCGSGSIANHVQVTCVAAAKTLLAKRQIEIRWVSVRVRFIPPNAACCCRCLMPGHVAVRCKGKFDRSEECYRYGRKGHKAAQCEAVEPQSGADHMHGCQEACNAPVGW
jgi:hypothetical protein